MVLNHMQTFKKGTLSNRAFAKYANVSEGTVRKARGEGALVIESDNRLDPTNPTNKQWIEVIHLHPLAGKKWINPNPRKKPISEKTKTVPNPKRSVTQKVSQPKQPKIHKQANEIIKLKIQKEREILKEKQIKNDLFRGKLIKREDVTQVFNKIYSVDSGHLKTLPQRIGPEIASICGVSDSIIINKVMEKIDDEVYRILKSYKKVMNDWLSEQKDEEDEQRDEVENNLNE